MVEQSSGMRATICMAPSFMQLLLALTMFAKKLPAASFFTTKVVPLQNAIVLGSGVVKRPYRPAMSVKLTCLLPAP